jgi:hypothetical protein
MLYLIIIGKPFHYTNYEVTKLKFSHKLLVNFNDYLYKVIQAYDKFIHIIFTFHLNFRSYFKHFHTK